MLQNLSLDSQKTTLAHLNDIRFCCWRWVMHRNGLFLIACYLALAGQTLLIHPIVRYHAKASDGHRLRLRHPSPAISLGIPLKTARTYVIRYNLYNAVLCFRTCLVEKVHVRILMFFVKNKRRLVPEPTCRIAYCRTCWGIHCSSASSNLHPVMAFFRFVCLVVVATTLLACGGGSGSGGGFGSLNDGSNASGGGGSGGCTYVLSSDITTPTRLINTQSACDYLLTEWIDVRSLLEIEPGTVIRSEADARIVVEGGELVAIGLPQQRIVFEGLANVQGYWRGIKVDGARRAQMDYVDIKDAGQVCSVIFCPDVGVIISNTVLSFTNSSVSNSYVHGMSITDGTRIEAFSNNRFFGNELNGFNTEIELIPDLDAASDYYGMERANGNPAVGVISGEQRSGRTFRWKALNAPYHIGGYLDVEGGILQIEPGAELVFGEEAWMTVQGNGVLKSLGTASDPIVFRGSQARPGHWDGIRMEDTSFDTSILQHTTLSHSGNTEGLLSAFAALRLDEAYITLNNTTFSDNAKWGIYCTERDSVTRASIVVDGGGNRFSNNASGALPTYCDIR